LVSLYRNRRIQDSIPGQLPQVNIFLDPLMPRKCWHNHDTQQRHTSSTSFSIEHSHSYSPWILQPVFAVCKWDSDIKHERKKIIMLYTPRRKWCKFIWTLWPVFTLCQCSSTAGPRLGTGSWHQ